MAKDNKRNNKKESQFDEIVVDVSRVAKVVKGGRRLRFQATVVIGDRKGKVGYGVGKATEVPEAIRKAIQTAKQNLVNVPIVGTTIPHEINGRSGGGHVFMRPAQEGSGVAAGGAVRAVFELAGVNDVTAKSLGSATPINVVRATFDGLRNLTTVEEVAKRRGLSVEEVLS